MSARAGEDNCPLTGQRSVYVIGVGAVGSMLSRSLAETPQLAELILVDKETLVPGNLIRHECFGFQVEAAKSTAMAEILKPPYGLATVRDLACDAVAEWPSVEDAIAQCDLVIDASGDWGVHEILARELVHKAVAWVYVKPGPDFGVIALKRPNSKFSLDDAQKLLHSRIEPALREKLEGPPRRGRGLFIRNPAVTTPLSGPNSIVCAPYATHSLRSLCPGAPRENLWISSH